MGIVRSFCKVMDKLADGQQNEVAEFKKPNELFIIERDIKYYDHESCRLDVCYKKDIEGKRPVLLLIHGGSFVAGDKYYRRTLMKWNADLGYFVVNINYGLGPKSKFPEPIQHVAYALNWIEQQAPFCNLDLDRIVVNGDSAGAYMATILTILSQNKELQEKYKVDINVNIKALVLICGIYDYYYALKKPFVGLAMKALLKDFVGIKKKDIKNYEYKELFNLLELMDERFPKSFVACSKKDIICGGQSQLLINRINELKLDSEVAYSTKLSDNHCYPLTWKSKAARECNDKIVEFMKNIK